MKGITSCLFCMLKYAFYFLWPDGAAGIRDD